MLDLYYEIVGEGYHIYDRNDPTFHIYQNEPDIPHPDKPYEENAQLQIDSIVTAYEHPEEDVNEEGDQ